MSKLIPKYQKGKPVKYFGAYNPKQQAYVLPVYKKEGVVLPEITITPKNNTDLGGYMQNRDFGLGKEIISYTPAGDVMDATQIYKDTKQGNYGQAAQLKAASKNPKKFTKEVLGLVPLIGFYGVNREDDKKYKNGGLIRRKRFIRND